MSWSGVMVVVITQMAMPPLLPETNIPETGGSANLTRKVFTDFRDPSNQLSEQLVAVAATVRTVPHASVSCFVDYSNAH